MDLLKEIDALVQKSDMTYQQVVECWLQNGLVKPDTFTNFGKMMKLNVSGISEVKPGMFYLSDGSIVREYPKKFIGNIKVVAIIACVFNGKALAVCTKGFRDKISFSSDNLVVDTSKFKSGKEATKFILEQAKLQNKRAEAAEFCVNYEDEGIPKGMAFLPTAEDMKNITSYYFNLCKAFKCLDDINVMHSNLTTSTTRISDGETLVKYYTMQGFVTELPQYWEDVVCPIIEIDLRSLWV